MPVTCTLVTTGYIPTYVAETVIVEAGNVSGIWWDNTERSAAISCGLPPGSGIKVLERSESDGT